MALEKNNNNNNNNAAPHPAALSLSSGLHCVAAEQNPKSPVC